MACGSATANLGPYGCGSPLKSPPVSSVDFDAALCHALGSDSWNDSAMVGDESRVVQAFCVWLVEHGWETQLELEHVDVVANRGEQRLYAEAKGRTSAVGLDLDTL
jgi:hypothetical protein